MGYLPTSPQRHSPGRVGVGKSLMLSRGEHALPLMVPSPRSPGARRADRPLADVLDDNAHNPLRRKYDPSKSVAPTPSKPSQSVTVRSLQRPIVSGLPMGLPFADLLAAAEAAPNVSTLVFASTPVNSGSSFGKSTRRSATPALPSPKEPKEVTSYVTNDTTHTVAPAMRKSRCYAYVPILSQSPVSETKAASDTKPVVESKKKVTFLTANEAKAVSTPKMEDTRAQDRQRIEQLERKLDGIESSKVAEIQAIRDAVQREKAQLDEEVQEMAVRAAVDDEKLRENRSILAGLKEENDKIRAMNQMMAKNNRSLRLNTESLEEALKSTTQLHERLSEYYKKEAQTQEKLEEKCRQLEQSIQWLQYQVVESTEYARRQSVRKGAYEEAFVALVPHLALNGHPDLARQVRHLYESATGAVNVEQDWTKSDVDTCSGTVSSTDVDSESELELYAGY